MRRQRKLWLLFSAKIAAWLVVSSLVGSAVGVGTYTFYYANGASYLTDDPQACVNCHVMHDQYDAWLKSSHRHVATCNDCHAPHDSLFAKYVCKGRNGFFHSLAFTTGNHPDPIQITPYNEQITEQACRYCHSGIVHEIDVTTTGLAEDQLSCIRCHADVGHFTH